MKKLWNSPFSIHDNFCFGSFELFIFEFIAVWRDWFLRDCTINPISNKDESYSMSHILWLISSGDPFSDHDRDHSFVESSTIEIRFVDVSAPFIFPKTVIPLLSCAIGEIVNAFIWLVDTSKPIIAKGELFALVFKSCVGVWSIFGAV